MPSACKLTRQRLPLTFMSLCLLTSEINTLDTAGVQVLAIACVLALSLTLRNVKVRERQPIPTPKLPPLQSSLAETTVNISGRASRFSDDLRVSARTESVRHRLVCSRSGWPPSILPLLLGQSWPECHVVVCCLFGLFFLKVHTLSICFTL